jgi:predicted DNA-binding ArsR family transcriptional regulator
MTSINLQTELTYINEDIEIKNTDGLLYLSTIPDEVLKEFYDKVIKLILGNETTLRNQLKFHFFYLYHILFS